MGTKGWQNKTFPSIEIQGLLIEIVTHIENLLVTFMILPIPDLFVRVGKFKNIISVSDILKISSLVYAYRNNVNAPWNDSDVDIIAISTDQLVR